MQPFHLRIVFVVMQRFLILVLVVLCVVLFFLSGSFIKFLLVEIGIQVIIGIRVKLCFVLV